MHINDIETKETQDRRTDYLERNDRRSQLNLIKVYGSSTEGKAICWRGRRSGDGTGDVYFPLIKGFQPGMRSPCPAPFKPEFLALLQPRLARRPAYLLRLGAGVCMYPQRLVFLLGAGAKAPQIS